MSGIIEPPTKLADDYILNITDSLHKIYSCDLETYTNKRLEKIYLHKKGISIIIERNNEKVIPYGWQFYKVNKELGQAKFIKYKPTWEERLVNVSGEYADGGMLNELDNILNDYFMIKKKRIEQLSIFDLEEEE